MRRREAVPAVDPRLRAQVFKHEPDRRRRAPRHRIHIGFGQAAAESFDDDIGVGGLGLDKCLPPSAEFNSGVELSVLARIDAR